MFTGIIDHTGGITHLQPQATGVMLRVNTCFESVSLGESIAVNGVCLTVISSNAGELGFDVSPETLSLTQIGTLAVGDKVNLERAVKAQGLMGGHWVTGHVDTSIQVSDRQVQGDYVRFDFSVPCDDARSLLVCKGSVTINGVSLTVNSVDATGFSVMCVPHTLVITQLSELQTGMFVNVEWDTMAKMIQRQVRLYLEKDQNNRYCSEEVVYE